MKRICLLAAAAILFAVQSSMATELDTKSMAVTIVFTPKKVDEATAIEIGRQLSQSSEAQRVSVREFKVKKTWALDLIWKHGGTNQSFQENVSFIESSIGKYGKHLIRKKYIASSVIWIEK